MPSKITNPKVPKWFTDRAIKVGDQIERNDGHTYQVYEIQGKIIYIHEPQILTPYYFQLTIITQDQFLNSYKII